MTAASRRTALCSTVAGLIAGTFAAPGLAADTRLIRLCGQLDALQEAFSDLFARRMTIEQEHATEPAMEALLDRQNALLDAIEAAGAPATAAGIAAVARTALALYPHRDAEGSTIAQDDSHWLLLVACEAMAGNA